MIFDEVGFVNAFAGCPACELTFFSFTNFMRSFADSDNLLDFQTT